MSNLLEQIKKGVFGKYAIDLLDLFVPLALKLPSLRENPKLMKASIKAVGQSGVTDVVTEADRYMQSMIKNQVLKLHPDWQFWGEEGKDNVSEYQRNKPFLVITDPIEGTNNFRAGLDDQWGSVVALVDSSIKEPIIGIVAHPTKRLFYFGIKGGGSYILTYNTHNKLIHADKMLPPPIYGYKDFTYNSSPHFSKQLMQVVDKFLLAGKVQPEKHNATALEKSRKTVLIKDNNGRVVKFTDPEIGALEAVRNKGTIYFKTSNEMAAVFVILGEIGGKVTDANGKTWSLGINTMISARTIKDYDYLKKLFESAKGKHPKSSA